MGFRDFFYLNKSDRKALSFILCIATIAISLLMFFGNDDGRTLVDEEDSVFIQKMPISSERNRKGDYLWKHEYRSRRPAFNHPYYRVGGEHKALLFPFDPNTADSTQLLQLGLSPWQVRNIYKYRARGGIYRYPEDFAQLYGLTLEQYRRLEPYIHIADSYQPASAVVKRPAHEAREIINRDTLLYPLKLRQGEHIVLNTADTTQLKKVPGIGSGWARQIAGYGARLGGYVSVSQLEEIDGFPEESLPYFVVSQPQPHKLNINKLTLNELRRHPYINFYQARAITDYRRLKGELQSLDQLHLLKEFPPEAIDRLRPYVDF